MNRRIAYPAWDKCKSGVLSILMACFCTWGVYAQCEFQITDQWSTPSSDVFTASLGTALVTIETTSPGLSAVSNISTSTRLTDVNPQWYSQNAADNLSLQLRFRWDITRGPEEEDIDDVGDDKETGIIRITFSEPVLSPVIHIDRLGGAGANNGAVGFSNSAIFTVTTPGITLSQPSGTGTDDFNVTATQIFKTPDVPGTNATPATGGNASQELTTGTAAGSVMLMSDAPITTVEFTWTGIGVEGTGGDEIELAISGIPGCMPNVELEKSIADLRGLSNALYEVDFQMKLTNSGDTTLSNISFIDDIFEQYGCAFRGVVTMPTVTMNNTSGISQIPSTNSNYDADNDPNIFLGNDGLLYPGDEIYVAFTILVDPGCAGVDSPLENQAMVQGTDPFGGRVTDLSDDPNDPTDQDILDNGNPDDPTKLEIPRIELLKMADDSNLSSPATPGDIIIYSFTVCNTGNTNLLNINITDPLVGLELDGVLSSLAVGECNTSGFSAQYAITTADLIAGGVANSAIVSATTPDGTTVTDTSDDPVDDTDSDPDMDGDPDDPTLVEVMPEAIIGLTKRITTSLDPNRATQVGDILSYSFEVCNLGGQPLSNVSIDDPLISITGESINLGLTECNTTSFTGTYSITQADIDNGSVINTAVVISSGPNGELVTNTSTEETALIIIPSISLRKGAMTDELPNPSSVGDLIEYSFEVCNTGNVTLSNIIIIDPLVTVVGLPIPLAPGACDQNNYQGSYAITAEDINNGTVQNSALVSANTPDGGMTDDISDDIDDPAPGPSDPTLAELNPCVFAEISLVSPGPVCLPPGQSILVNAALTEISASSGDIDIRYLLVSAEGVIEDIATIPAFNIAAAGVYHVVILQAELTDPTSGNYVDPSLIILGTNLLSDLAEFISSNDLCGRIDDDNVQFSVFASPEITLESNVRICNSGDLEMPFTINLAELIQSDALIGDWSLSAGTPIPEDINESIPRGGSGLIPSGFLDFTGVTPGTYTLEYVTTSAQTPCVDDRALIDIEVIDCESKCDELICNGLLQLSLSESCELVLNADQLLESPAIGLYRIELYNEDESYYGNDTVRADAAGQTLLYKVMCGENSCWGRLIVETNIIPTIESPCACQPDGVIPEACQLWCGDESAVADILITPEEAAGQFGLCGPELIGEISVRHSSSGDICELNGEVHTVTYSGKVLRHGIIEEIDILCQQYTQLKFNIGVSDDEFNANFGFPKSVELDCDYIDELNDNEDGVVYEFGTPKSIEAATDSSVLAYPHYINRHILIQDSVLTPDTQLVLVGERIVDSLVMVDIDGDGIDEWELIKFSVKDFDTIFSEVLVPTGLASHPLVSVKNRACNLLVSYSDVEYNSCGQGVKIVRSWTMVDWCNADIQRTGTQTIEVKDISAPQAIEIVDGENRILGELPAASVGIDPWTCTGIFKLPEILQQDNCDENVEIIWTTDEGTIRDGYVTNIWIDQSPIQLTASLYDDCLNKSTVSMILEVIDDVPPVPVADDQISVSLAYGNPGEPATAKIYASDIDEGSHDSDCGEVILKVVRMDDWTIPAETCDGTFVGYEPQSCDPMVTQIDLGNDNAKANCLFDSTNIEGVVTEPADFIKLCCEDVGSEVMAILFAIDKAGNRNQAMVRIVVNDQSVPTLFCEDSDFGCDEDREELEELIEESAPEIIGGACDNPFLEPEIASQTFKSESCGAGLVTIEWFLDVDGSGDPTFGDPFCTQFIEIESDGETLDASTIKWPRHYTGESYVGINLECDSTGTIITTEQEVIMPDPFVCSPDLSEDEGPEWCYSDCGIVGVSSEIDTLKSGEECFKLIRRWTVIDWCIWDANAGLSDADDDEEEAESNTTEIDIEEPDEVGGIGGGNLIGEMDSAIRLGERSKKNKKSDGDTFRAVEDWAQGVCSGCNENGTPAISDPIYFVLDEFEEDGYYTFDQIIKVVDDNPPIIVAPDTIIVDVINGSVSKDDLSGCFGAMDVRARGFDFCNFDRSSNLLSWHATISDSEGELLSDLLLVEHYDVSTASVTATVSQELVNGGVETVLDGPTEVENRSEGLSQFADLFDIIYAPDRITLTVNPGPEIESLTEQAKEENIYRLYFDIIDFRVNGLSLDPASDALPEFELFPTGVFYLEFGSISELTAGDMTIIQLDSDVTQVVTSSTGVGAPGDIHTITWSARDNCGNQATERTIVRFVDGRAPTPVCVSAVTTAFMESDGTVGIWATDFDFGSFDNCSDVESLRYSIVESGESPLQPDQDDFGSQSSIDLSCSSSGSFYELDVWVWDRTGNGDYCTVSVLVNDDNEFCGEQPSSAAITGSIKTEGQVAFSGATVSIEASMTEYPKEDVTDEAGTYAFMQNPLNENYRLRPAYEDIMLNGVSTLDLVHIQRHILSLAPLDSPYKIMAADINSDQSVSAADIVALRQLIIGQLEDIASTDSWMFIKEEQSFFDESAPWPYIEDIIITNLQYILSDQDFIALKMGDMNQSASLNGVGVTEIRSPHVIRMSTSDADFQVGDQIDVALKVDEASVIKGFQFGLRHNKLEIIDISSSASMNEGTHYLSQNGTLRVSWSDVERPITSELLTITFIAQASGRLSDLLVLSEDVLQSEAYSGDHLDIHELELYYIQQKDQIELYQNHPNPFSDQTFIDFYLPDSDQLVLRVLDHTGRVLIKESGYYVKGLHQYVISAQDLAAGSGLFYYEIITSRGNLTKKMIFSQ